MDHGVHQIGAFTGINKEINTEWFYVIMKLDIVEGFGAGGRIGILSVV
jgi:hypothetical protein